MGDEMSSRVFGWQAGNDLQREKDKTSGTGMFILSRCPICDGNRRLGDHRKCSREMQKRYNFERNK